MIRPLINQILDIPLEKIIDLIIIVRVYNVVQRWVKGLMIAKTAFVGIMIDLLLHSYEPLSSPMNETYQKSSICAM